MVNLCYQTFLELVIDHYSYAIESELLAKNILRSITPESEHEKFESSSYLSLFWTRKRNIPKEIVTFSQTPESKRNLQDYFKNYVIPDLNESLKEEFFQKLEMLISNDDTILSRKKKAFRNLQLGEKDKYLTEVFLYAITKPNKCDVTEVDKDTIPLLAQVDQQCPLCHTPLIKVTKGKTNYKFSVTRIYPEFLDSEYKDAYDAIKPKPSEPDDIINKICLCDECSANYIFNPTTKMYEKLLKLKRQSMFVGATSLLSDYKIEDKVKEILEKIATTNPEGDLIKDFRMKPVDPCHKISEDNYLLLKTIKNDNEVFFWYIKDCISQLDANKSSFDIIATEIKTAFLKLESEGYDQNDIYYGIIDWIIRKQILPNSYRDAVHVIVSYFVQSCEVFK